MGRLDVASPLMLRLEELTLTWRPPEQLSCTAVVPRHPLGSDPPTHLDIHLSFNLLEAPANASDSNRMLLKLGSRAAEGGGGKLRTSADVPQNRAIERSGSGLWRVQVRARLLWEKEPKGTFEHGPQLESWIVIPAAEVSHGDVPPMLRAGCLQAMQKAAREADTDSHEHAHYQMLLRQLLMAWRHKSRGDEVKWLSYCGLPEDEAQAVLKECLLDPLEAYVLRLRGCLNPEPLASTPVGLWEAWVAGQSILEAWRTCSIHGEAPPPATGNFGVALEQLQRDLQELLAGAWLAIEKPVQEPLQKITSQVCREQPDIEMLWRVRSESRAVLLQWPNFRGRLALLSESGGEEAEVGNRITVAANELRLRLPAAEEVLAKDLEARVQEMGRILQRIEAASELGNPKTVAGAVQAAIASSQTLLHVWSQHEEHSRAFWDAIVDLGASQSLEANGQILPKEIWAVWSRGFTALTSWEELGDKGSASHTENERFRGLLDDLKSCLAELLMATLQVLPRSLNYPLVLVEEESGADFGKVHIGGYEALQLCIRNQPRIAALASEGGAAGKVGNWFVEAAARLQEQVLADIHSTSKNLEIATAEETKEVEELIEALQSLDFDLTRWNFMRPCVAKMAMGPGAVGEMMRRLLGLADRVRAARDAKDLQHICTFVSYTPAACSSFTLPPAAMVIDVTPPAVLQQGTEIRVGAEYHQVRSAGQNVHIVTRLRYPLDASSALCRMEVAPLVPSNFTVKGWSQAFLDTVENFRAELQDSADDIVKLHYGWLPTDVKARKIALLAMYTVNTLYCDVNKALYENDRQLLWSTAAFIRELRDVFLVGQAEPIVEPFIGGTVVRSLVLEDHRLTTFAAQYQPGQAVCWASFTSTSSAGELRHDGNVLFRIRCGKMGPPKSGQYYPSSVKAFSAFPAEDEVIFPPHCFLRIVNLALGDRSLTIEMETMEFADVWEMIRHQDWNSFNMWASKNPELVDTRAYQFSIIGAIAEAINRPLDRSSPNPFDTCVRHGADVYESHGKDTPVAILERKLANATAMNKQIYADWLSSLRKHAANSVSG